MKAISEAHDLLAAVLWKQWQWAEAESEYKRALELNPNDAIAHGGFSHWLLSRGRIDEALEWGQRGCELDPVAVSGNGIAWTLFLARRYDDAQHELRSVLSARPNDVTALWDFGFVMIAKGQSEAAIPSIEKTVSITHRGS